MKNAAQKSKLSHLQLTSTIPESWLPFKTTLELPVYQGMFGQERAMNAIDIGLKIDARGFNIFAVGESGSGKTSTIERILKDRAASEPIPDDLLYVTCFKNTSQPRPIFVPPGSGRKLASDMEGLVKELWQSVPRVLSESVISHIRAGILGDTRRKADDLLKRATKAAEKLNLLIEEGDDTLRVVPLKDGEPLDPESFEKLDRSTRRKIEANMIAFQEHLDAFSYRRRPRERKHSKKTLEAEVRVIQPLVEELFSEIMARYQKCGKGVAEFLIEAKKHILDNHRTFLPLEDDEDVEETDSQNLERYPIYKVNVVVDHTDQKGAPVIVERMPKPDNLCGYFEHREAPGGLVTDHTMIRAGAFHQANGGYLLIQASDLLSHQNAWDCLKRTLRHRGIRIEEGAAPTEGRPREAGMMKPGTVSINQKTILVGSSEIYYILKTEDEDFNRLFKIKADFEPYMRRSRNNVMKLAQFLGQVCQEENLLPIHRTGMLKIIAFASRNAGHKERLTNRKADLLDLVAEANFFARERHARAVRDIDVNQASASRNKREGAIADILHREIREGTIMIQTKETAVGQINGIALYDVVGNAFGIPVRITARTYAGRRGVVNIDREVQLSGAIHDKGAMIMIGYLGGRYAQKQTLGFSASITFEQSYDEIDGDSASSAELYALLSALANVPIRQGIAVTGSVNQLGEIQPIGGVNEKIEGIFRLCNDRGLTGNEGVMIPKANVKNLMLSDQVVDAVRTGKFSIYAITSVDEGIEVLTGLPAGKRLNNGHFAEESINFLVAQQLKTLQAVLKSVGVPTSLDTEL
jgi:lon-related putative ATP-dependent protease